MLCVSLLVIKMIPPFVIPLAALALSAAGTGWQMSSAAKDKKRATAELEKSRKAQVALETPQAVKDQLADAQSKNGATNPALIGAYQQALQAQANQQSFAQRNASSGAQALSAASEAQSNTQSMLPQLAMMQTDYNQQNRGAYVDALRASTEDSRLKTADAAERNQASQQFALGQLGAANQNRAQAIGAGVAALGSVLNYAGQTAGTNTRMPSADFMGNTNGAGMPMAPLQPTGFSQAPLVGPQMRPMPISRFAMGQRAYNPYNFYNPYGY